MTNSPIPMVEIWRGPILESLHSGHAVITGPDGEVLQAWGDPQAVILPRSSAKMLQALPLVASGAATAYGLGREHLALACASHQGAPLHVDKVTAWLEHIGYGNDDLICGPEASRDKTLRFDMIRNGQTPCRIHNNCSGKHSGFLTLTRHLGAQADYVDPDHPVQQACRETFEDLTGVTSPGFGIDGCSAPNFATTMAGMARAMSYFATAHHRNDTQSKAAAQLVDAMMAHPELVAGEGRACTGLMRAAREPVAIKTGAEGYFVAILPTRGLGISLKIIDGATRASNSAMAALLVQLGILDANDPAVGQYLSPEIRNWDGLVTGAVRPAPDWAGTASALS